MKKIKKFENLDIVERERERERERESYTLVNKCEALFVVFLIIKEILNRSGSIVPRKIG